MHRSIRTVRIRVTAEPMRRGGLAGIRIDLSRRSPFNAIHPVMLAEGNENAAHPRFKWGHATYRSSACLDSIGAFALPSVRDGAGARAKDSLLAWACETTDRVRRADLK
jgi:hypothetical protein